MLSWLKKWKDAVELSGVELGSSGRVAYVCEAMSAAKISVTHRGTSLKAKSRQQLQQKHKNKLQPMQWIYFFYDFHFHLKF